MKRFNYKRCSQRAQPCCINSLMIILGLASFSWGCSLEKPKTPGGTLRIQLQDQMQSLGSTLGIPSIFSFPTSASDFTCFAANITGEGISSKSDELHNCTTADNMQGKGTGILTDLFKKGEIAEVEVPAGKNRSIDVYGLFPADFIPECGGNSPTNGTHPTVKGFFLGNQTKTLTDSDSVTIPIAFSSSQKASFTCTDSGTGQGSNHVALADGTTGTAKAVSTCSSATISTTVPAPGTANVAFSGAELGYVSTSDSILATKECTSSAGSQYMVVEFQFYANPNTVYAYYSSLAISWTGQAGYYATSCSSGNPSAVSGAQIDIYNDLTGLWESIGSPSTTTTTVARTFSPAGDYVHAASGSVRVRVIGGLSATINHCSTVKTDFISATFF